MISRAAAAVAASLTTLASAAHAQAPGDTTGPYAVVMEEDASLPGHTIYRPQDVTAVEGGAGLILWGNGGCANRGTMYESFLGELASQGYVVTAPGPIEPTGERGQSKPGQMMDALKWAEGEPYGGALDLTRVAAMGHSCGGLEAIAAGADERIATILVLNSGIIRGGIPTPDGGTREPAGYLPATEEDLPNLRAPALYLIGGPTDQAHRGAEGDFEALNTIPLFNANLGVGHGGTWRQPHGGAMGEAAMAWLDWRLNGDEAAGRMFTGANCGLCADPEWTVKKKNID